MSTPEKSLPQISGEIAAVQTEHLHTHGAKINAAFGWDLDAEDAVVKYLIERHHWLPRDVRAMPLADLLLCLEPLALSTSKRR